MLSLVTTAGDVRGSLCRSAVAGETARYPWCQSTSLPEEDSEASGSGTAGLI